MTSTTLIPSALDALLTGFDSVLSIDVVEGPPVQNEEDTGLFVGASGDDVEIPAQQRWPGLAHVHRDETFEIPCQLYRKSGDSDPADFKTIRNLLFADLALIETWLRTHVDLGMAGSNNVRAQFGETFSYFPVRTGDGLLLRIDFNINIEGRI